MRLRSLTTKLPKPLKYTFCPFAKDDLMLVMNDSTAFRASALSNPVSSAIPATMSALVIIPAHNIPSFKPAKTFVDEVKNKVKVK